MLNALLHGSELISNQVVQAYFLQALTWSMGAALLEDGRVKLDQYIKYISAMLLIEPSVALAGPGQSVRRYSLDVLICWPAFCHAVHARTHAHTHAHTHTHTHTHTSLTAFFRDYPGEPVPERQNQSGFY